MIRHHVRFCNKGRGFLLFVAESAHTLEGRHLIPFLITLLVCQLLGEVTVIAFGLPLPGPVVGMAVLFLWLTVAGKTTGNFEILSNQLLSHLSLLFVPAGVGVMLHAELLGEELVPIAVALVVSTLITLALTGWIMNKLGPETRDS